MPSCVIQTFPPQPKNINKEENNSQPEHHSDEQVTWILLPRPSQEVCRQKIIILLSWHISQAHRQAFFSAWLKVMAVARNTPKSVIQRCKQNGELLQSKLISQEITVSRSERSTKPDAPRARIAGTQFTWRGLPNCVVYLSNQNSKRLCSVHGSKAATNKVNKNYGWRMENCHPWPKWL